MQKFSQSLATGQPVPSLTWKKVTKKCSQCGNDFEATIWQQNGKEGGAGNLCLACDRNERKEKQRESAKKRLAELCDHQRELWYDQCGLEGRWFETSFETFKHELCPKAFDAVKGFDSGKGKSLLLRSDNYGVGKTHLVAALINHLLQTKEPAKFRADSYSIITYQCPALFITEIKLLDRIRQTFNHSEETEPEEHIYKSLRQTPLLIIDDVGKVKPRDLSFLQGVYYRIIDDRYTSELPMLLTTNLTLTELEAHIGGASSDRLREMCGKEGFISITGKSYRR